MVSVWSIESIESIEYLCFRIDIISAPSIGQALGKSNKIWVSNFQFCVLLEVELGHGTIGYQRK